MRSLNRRFRRVVPVPSFGDHTLNYRLRSADEHWIDLTLSCHACLRSYRGGGWMSDPDFKFEPKYAHYLMGEVLGMMTEDMGPSCMSTPELRRAHEVMRS